MNNVKAVEYPLKPAASSLAERPSTMKLFEKLRWLPTEIPWPAQRGPRKELIVAVLVGEPRHEQCDIKEAAPVQGEGVDFACQTVPATWVRAALRQLLRDDGYGWIASIRRPAKAVVQRRSRQ